MELEINRIIKNEIGVEPNSVEKAAEGLTHDTYFIEADDKEYIL